MPKQAAIYARVSVDKDDDHLAVDRQREACAELADRLGLTVTAEHYYEDNGISAYTGKPRPDFKRMIRAVEAGEIQAVVVWALDRMYRSTLELEELITLCETRQLTIHVVTGGEHDLSSVDGATQARVMTAFAVGENKKKIARQKAANLQRAKAGKWNGRTRPFGYEADGVTVREHEAATVRWAASQLLAGNSIRSIAAELNRRGVKTATGGRWIPKTIGNLLQNPRLAGYAVYGGKDSKGNRRRPEIIGRAVWPAILDEDVWRGVVAVLQDPARRKQNGTARVWLGSGLYLCGVCGATVTTTSDPGHGAGGRTQTAYICRSGGHVYRQATAVDEFIEEITIGVLSTRGADLLVPDQTEDTSALHLQDAALRARLDELGRLYGDGTIDAAQLAQGTAAIRQQREQVEAQLAAASRGSVLAGVADAPDPEPVWQGLDLSRKRAVVDCLMTVTILPTERGQRRGQKRHATRFDPASVRIEPKR
jgi:site-specific DNA recombinase